MEPSNYVYFARGTGQMAAHNRSENSRGASAALYAHPTHTHTLTLLPKRSFPLGLAYIPLQFLLSLISLHLDFQSISLNRLYTSLCRC
jgi:hypothetical protein